MHALVATVEFCRHGRTWSYEKAAQVLPQNMVDLFWDRKTVIEQGGQALVSILARQWRDLQMVTSGD
eukprot:7418090-Lingulodinium_polyedra.AAC.1